MPKITDSWIPFFLDCNQGWGWCDTKEEFERIVSIYTHATGQRYEALRFLLRAKCATFATDDQPNFGHYTYAEHTGELTLDEFLKCNGIHIPMNGSKEDY